MFSVDLTTSECGDRVVVALCGELDVVDAAAVAAALAAVAGRGRVVIVDLARLAFIDSSGVAALARARRHARRTAGDLLLAAPQRQVGRVLDVTRQADAFSIHTDVTEAAARVGGFVAVVPAAAPRALLPAT